MGRVRVTLFRRPWVLMASLLILVMGAAFLTQVVPYGQILDSRQQVDDARNQLAELESDNAALQADIEALQTDSEIEKLAREKLGYVRPGETAFVVLDPPGTPDESEPLAEPTVPDDKTWVDRVWEFLSGADQG